jgi:hypothetical protein
MRSSMLALVLLTPICFAAMQIPQSTGAVLVSASRSLPGPAEDQVPESCPVTKPPTHPFVPPSPYPNETGPDGFWIGTNKLWMGLRLDGTWQRLPQWPDGTFRQKLFWWHEGYNARRDPRPSLKVTGKRLDSPAPPIQSEASNGWTDDADHPFIVNGINLPSLGCWRITGHFEDAELSFVVWAQ